MLDRFFFRLEFFCLEADSGGAGSFFIFFYEIKVPWAGFDKFEYEGNINRQVFLLGYEDCTLEFFFFLGNFLKPNMISILSYVCNF